LEILLGKGKLKKRKRRGTRPTTSRERGRINAHRDIEILVGQELRLLLFAESNIQSAIDSDTL